MPASPRIALVGGGKMGEAILAGWLKSSTEPAAHLAAENFTVINPGAERRAYLESTYAVATVADAAELASAQPFDMVVLAVKPQIMLDVLAGLSPLASFKSSSTGPLYISIAAGLSTETLSAALPLGATLVRVMPNTPLSIGAGASAVCGAADTDGTTVEYVRQLFACLGSAVIVDESVMDVVCALSGSGPAYVAAMIEALTAAAADQGLQPDLAETLAVQTVLGTARLIDETDLGPKEARLAVCSPGGTTLAALEAMNAAGFADVFAQGVAAAVKRGKELG